MGASSSSLSRTIAADLTRFLGLRDWLCLRDWFCPWGAGFDRPLACSPSPPSSTMPAMAVSASPSSSPSPTSLTCSFSLPFPLSTALLTSWSTCSSRVAPRFDQGWSARSDGGHPMILFHSGHVPDVPGSARKRSRAMSTVGTLVPRGRSRMTLRTDIYNGIEWS